MRRLIAALLLLAQLLPLAAHGEAAAYQPGKQHVLTYSMVGYAAQGAKRALVRQLVERTQASPDTWHLYRLAEETDSARTRAQQEGIPAYGEQAAQHGEKVLEGACIRAPRTFRCTYFVCDMTEAREEGVYVLQVSFTDGSALYSAPFPISPQPFGEQVLYPLSVHNAQARFASGEANLGYYDCNNTFGEAYSHGTFLYGLSHYAALCAAGWPKEQQDQLYWAACQAYDYLMRLWQPSGEIAYAAPERPGDAAHNAGVHNSMEALVGLACFMSTYAGRDPGRVSEEALDKALKTLQYVDTCLKLQGDTYYYGGWKLTALCRLYLAFGREELLQEAYKAAEVVLRKVDYASGHRDQVCSAFEGLWLLCRIDPAMRRHELLLVRAEEWRQAAQTIVTQSAFRFPGFSGSLDGMADAYLGAYFPDRDIRWVLNQSVLNIARDVCFLWELTDDDAFEQIAAGALHYVAGCNFGVPQKMATVDGSSGGTMTCASFISNSYGGVKPWTWWAFGMQNDDWASIVNGYVVLPAELARRRNGYRTGEPDYNYTNQTWEQGETFIRMDGMMLCAASLYESMLAARRSPHD